jgi:hypothetical protein
LLEIVHPPPLPFLSVGLTLGEGMFPIRLVSPLIAIGIAGFCFLPETSGNILALTKEYEARLPVIWDTHQELAKDPEHLKQETAKKVEQVRDKLGITNK